MIKRSILKAYTLQEIIIVMLIISVIVAVTIGVTKKKLDSTLSYTYYSGYEIVRNVSRSLLADYNPNDEAYQAMLPLSSVAYSKGNKFTDIFHNLWSQPAFAADPNRENDVCPSGYIMQDGECIPGYKPGGDFEPYDPVVPVNPVNPVGPVVTQCIAPKININGTCVCPNTCNGTQNPVTCECISNEPEGCAQPAGGCGEDKIWDQDSCSCIDDPNAQPECTPPSGGCSEGKIWDQDSCSCIDDPNAQPECIPPSGGCGEGKIWDQDSCSCVNSGDEGDACSASDPLPACNQQCIDGHWAERPGFSNTCNELTQVWKDLPDCKCVPIPRTLPLNDFCERFEAKVNSKAGDTVCSGTSITSSTTDFSDKTPDIILRNGMKLYNLSAGIQKLPELDGNKSGATVAHPSFAALEHAQISGSSGSSLNLSDGWSNFLKRSYNNVRIAANTLSKNYASNSSSQNTNLSSSAQSGLNSSALNSNLNDISQKYQVSADYFANNKQQFYDKFKDLGLINEHLQFNNFNQAQLQDLLSQMSNMDTGEWGYIVYVDINGQSGSSTLWEDVFPFYITLNGYVIPAYNNPDDQEIGGNSKDYLQTSVQYETINNNGKRTIKWLAKSVSFREGACKSGYIDPATPYCAGITELPECAAGESTGNQCSLKTVKPIKFF